jgi:hypothetical protein
MNSDRLASLALRAYPADVPADRRAEMLDTLRDVRTATPERYAVELIDLVRRGVRTRADRRGSAGTGRLLADGFCLGGVLIAMFEFGDLGAHYVRGLRDTLVSPLMAIALALIIAAALVGFDRAAGLGAMIWLVVRLPELYHAKDSVVGVLPSIVPLACFAVMTAGPRRLAVNWWQLGWFLAPALLIATFGPDRPNPALMAVVALAAVAVLGMAVVLAPIDPRLAIACAAPAAYLGLQIVWKDQAPIVLSTIFLGALPAALIYAVAHRRHTNDARI